MSTDPGRMTTDDYLVHLVRLGCEGKARDVEMLGRLMARRLKVARPELAARLEEVLAPHADPMALLRRPAPSPARINLD